jgi:hypothetical protein
VGESQTVNEWKRQGAAEGLRRALRELLQDRFGPLADGWQARIDAIVHPDRLSQAVRQAVRLARLDDLQL